MIASGASKVGAVVLTYPLQVVRTRMQARNADQTRYDSAFIWLSRDLHLTPSPSPPPPPPPPTIVVKSQLRKHHPRDDARRCA
mmetsp:Transcript_20809/g.55579  ORF Transcript_20809/g.55579 Transcript_20809/m.55579 type:complete len:83 (-) Transcript_20809:800-1048(-)